MPSLTYADLFWVIVVALILAIAYILWTTREKKTEKNLFREKKGSSSLTVLIEIAAIAFFGYIILDSIGMLPKSVKNGVNWTSSNFGLLVFLSCFTIGAYVLLKFSGNKNSHAHGNAIRLFDTKYPLLLVHFCHLASIRAFNYAFSISTPGKWPHFSFSNYVLRKSGSGLSC